VGGGGRAPPPTNPYIYFFAMLLTFSKRSANVCPAIS
jgi:hypothetical protein